MFLVFSFIAIALFVFIFGNILIYKTIVKKSVSSYLAPYFRTKQKSIVKIEFAGLLSSGDFETPFFEITPVPKMGKISNNTYVNVYVVNSSNNEYRYTVKIRTFFLKVQEVTLKSKIENIEIKLPRTS